jgi:nucleolar GTP-binding protein
MEYIEILIIMEKNARHTGNPFAKIALVETPQELLDLAFSKSMKILSPSMKRVSKLERKIEHEKNRINTAANVISDRLYRIIKQFPSIDQIHPFYTELTNVLIGSDKLKKALGRIDGVVLNLRQIAHELISECDRSSSVEDAIDTRSKAFGRFSNMTYQLHQELDLLQEARNTLAVLPGLDPLNPCVVVAGVPNVGKSSFVSAATTGKPEVASYPFTTKKLVFGHLKLGFLQIQFCDTPGLLDRSLAERNEIELQAIAALKHISDVLVIIIDPSISATYSLKHQVSLVGEFIEYYPGAEVILLINKADLFSKQEHEDTLNEVNNSLKLSNISSTHISKIMFISSLKSDDIKEVISNIEYIVKYKILKTSKFKNLVRPEIAVDQYLLEELSDDDIKHF